MATTAMASSLLGSTANCIPEEPVVPSAAPSLTYSEESEDQEEEPQPPKRRRASTRLIAQSPADIQRITGESTAQLIKRCCGGSCCMKLGEEKDGLQYEAVTLPDNDAYKSLALKINRVPTTLTNVADMPEQTVFFEPVPRPAADATSPTDSAVSLGPDTRDDVATLQHQLKDFTLDDIDTTREPPKFVQPHPPYHVYAARIDSTRELTKSGAEKRTYHFDLDITSYPGEEDMDFRVGGAIGVMAPNDNACVDDVFDALMVPRFIRDKPVLMKTTRGRWPTVWGDDQARQMVTTRRDLLTWCSDIQSYPPTKQLLRILAEYAADSDEKKLLTYLCAAEGQGVFCDFRTGPHVSLSQLLNAFPSSHPPLDLLLSVLQPLMPRFYSLSNDPHDSFKQRDGKTHRLVEIAVTVHETSDWRGGQRTGIGSGFFERQAHKWMEAKSRGDVPEVHIPMFKGLMANPLAKQFVSDGPMLLIGAGVGIAPFRGFVQRRLKTANCANKVWVLQGIRDSLVDEIYSGEWGVHEDEVKRVVQSRRGESRYVQEEVRNQADLVWYISNAVDGRVFVCGSSRGMGEGVEEALVDVAMSKGNLEREEAKKYWELKKEAGQYIAETW
ncbi:putative FAD-binding protein [Colletotrichum orbiculare MAFF 240422]|uniref:FAD-binding protein n=1 Tax=Colletotrichum orbiculare (strain 104-T / ATCC 96160 / CBS 514.97 / LARS 414 / MAFF 240422) TaxID=1213857 RepID=A0A484FUJ0_COLOR|nr:putative FAD-binding protein [Colletotrichum orbiculare MAFF 240422]